MTVLAPERIDDELRPAYTPDEIVDALPEGAYTDHYQPTYPDREDLRAAVAELQQTTSVTNPEHIHKTRQLLGQAAVSGFIALKGSCAEPILVKKPVSGLAADAKAVSRAVLDSTLGRALGEAVMQVNRDRGQGIKPRSDGEEEVTPEIATAEIPAGSKVVSYMGDGVNSTAIDQRIPDPSRMVAMAAQARDLEEYLTIDLGHHVPAAHEALSLSYEKAQIVVDAGGKEYLQSADVPWIGARTNRLTGEHVAMLSHVENTVGVKISDKSDTEHIRGLAEALNPNNEAGKLIFMLRVGGGKPEQLGEVLDAIRNHAPNAIVMYDIHGVTKINEYKEKIRAVPDIISEITELTLACNDRGLRLSGVHLETIGNNRRLECVDDIGDRPTHPGCVDPRLNPRQLTMVLDGIAEVVLSQDERLRKLKAKLN